MSCVQQNRIFIASNETQRFIQDSFVSVEDNRIIKIKWKLGYSFSKRLDSMFSQDCKAAIQSNLETRKALE